ncbi:MAG: M23 family metallopeptidase [Candidatus Cardinium sp.]|uniref:M23 family metallopeptidase n=1 Tax=Cardinium endosymbiont of Dermatophagoides farinae TaxID=2597823 RepID=UPI001182F798|nr:M23 family metallopeptidase [Cardinium endosymbiont of Dermatophagoides farinae]TSJ81425.1 M23 family metallopeptidase [Cardinium endosymbiont of Dermatophagoides farinae]UWW97487.1 MAG: M23 family metallopeptidase [Candidatus Cardinium sp.]
MNGSLRTHRRFLDYFERRYQLVIRNVENFAEHITPPFSYATIITLLLSWLCISFGLSLWLAKTALARWMNPIYIETENQKKILSLARTVETFEKQFTSQTAFIATLQKIIRGKSKHPLAHTPPPSTPEPTETVSRTEPSAAATNQKQPTNNRSPLLFPPINGMVTKSFHKEGNHYGVDIVAKEKDPIKATSAGVVIFSDWSVDTGWVVVIQHYNNVVSIYKHCAILFKKVGNLVRAGDVIALMGNSGEISTGPHLHFELWSEGVALNPEDYINF